MIPTSPISRFQFGMEGDESVRNEARGGGGSWMKKWTHTAPHRRKPRESRGGEMLEMRGKEKQPLHPKNTYHYYSILCPNIFSSSSFSRFLLVSSRRLAWGKRQPPTLRQPSNQCIFLSYVRCKIFIWLWPWLTFLSFSSPHSPLCTPQHSHTHKPPPASKGNWKNEITFFDDGSIGVTLEERKGWSGERVRLRPTKTRWLCVCASLDSILEWCNQRMTKWLINNMRLLLRFGLKTLPWRRRWWWGLKSMIYME